jgi:hypothetical protein
VLEEFYALGRSTHHELALSSGLLSYDVITPLWSDGASKQRWISVPDGAAIGFAETGSCSFLVLEGPTEPIHLSLPEGQQHQLSYLFPGPDDRAVVPQPGGSVGARRAHGAPQPRHVIGSSSAAPTSSSRWPWPGCSMPI